MDHAHPAPVETPAPPVLHSPGIPPLLREAADPSALPPVLPEPPVRQFISPLVFVGLGALLLAAVLAMFAKGELGHFLQGSWQVVVFAVMCVLAYLGLGRPWARVLAWLVLGLALLLSAGMNLGFTYLALSGGELGDKPFNSLPAGGAAVLGLVFVATLLAAQSALLARLPSFQRVCTPLTGNDEWTSVRQLALATVVSFTLVCCVPLAALGQPPLLQALQSSPGAVSLITDGRGAAGLLRDQMYALTWTLMAAALAVGCGIRRNGPETLERLGLKRISIRQLGGAVLLTGLLLGLAQLADVGITRLWQGFGWPMTDLAAVEALFDPFISPLGAVVIGITAGVGEEVAVRGILQPRLGILLSNLFFTALHAYQYNWDGLFSVFLTGLALGFIRKQTSTTVSAIVHGGFDFVLVIAAVLQGGAGE